MNRICTECGKPLPPSAKWTPKALEVLLLAAAARAAPLAGAEAVAASAPRRAQARNASASGVSYRVK